MPPLTDEETRRNVIRQWILGFPRHHRRRYRQQYCSQLQGWAWGARFWFNKTASCRSKTAWLEFRWFIFTTHKW